MPGRLWPALIVDCPTCRAPVVGDDVDLLADRALCRPCGELFALPALRDELARPAELEVTELRVEGGVRLRWTPRRALGVAFGTFAAVWNAIMFTVAWRAFPMTAPHLLAGIFLAYLAAAMLMNHHDVDVALGRLHVELGPVPWRGGFELPLSAIEAVTVSAGAVVPHLTNGSRRAAAWHVRVSTSTSSHPLPIPFSNHSHAEYVAERLRRAVAEARMPRGYRS